MVFSRKVSFLLFACVGSGTAPLTVIVRPSFDRPEICTKYDVETCRPAVHGPPTGGLFELSSQRAGTRQRPKAQKEARQPPSSASPLPFSPHPAPSTFSTSPPSTLASSTSTPAPRHALQPSQQARLSGLPDGCRQQVPKQPCLRAFLRIAPLLLACRADV